VSFTRSRHSDWTWRRRFSVVTVLTTVLLLSWGGVVTSIGAGMAFPDWPTSLGSYNLLNPVEGWWQVPAYLAEHGHRLIASLVGMFTVVLAAWTWWEDPRAWMRKLGIGAVVLVVAQGILGGLRVLWVSLDLAMIHACVAQLFFAVLVAMTLFVTDTWRGRRGVLPTGSASQWLRGWSYAAAVGIYLQIVLGALLRHPGAGMSGGYTALHVTGAFVVVGVVLGVFVLAEKHFDALPAIRRTAWVLTGTMGLQFVLGLASLLLTLYEPAGQGGVWAYVGLTVGHLVVGALLFGASIVMALLASRTRAPAPAQETASSSPADVAEPTLAGMES
jgi:cytochrome c oxidase assembly protein subunit 15